MIKEKLARVFAAGWHNFRRNSYVTLGTTGVMTLVLFLFLGLMAVNFLGGVVINGLEGKVDVSLYLKAEATEGDISLIRDDLEALNTVAAVNYVSREEALASFKERHAQDALIQESLAELETNPLQASLNVSTPESVSRSPPVTM